MRMVKSQDELVLPLLYRLGTDLDRLRAEIRDLKHRVGRLETHYGAASSAKN